MLRWLGFGSAAAGALSPSLCGCDGVVWCCKSSSTYSHGEAAYPSFPSFVLVNLKDLTVLFLLKKLVGIISEFVAIVHHLLCSYSIASLKIFLRPNYH